MALFEFTDNMLHPFHKMVCFQTHMNNRINPAGILLILCSCCSVHPILTQVRVVRSEESGFLNIVPVSVYYDDKKIGTLADETTLVIPSSEGEHALRIEYHNPYTDRDLLKYKERRIKISKRITTFKLTAIASDASTCSGEWDLESICNEKGDVSGHRDKRAFLGHAP